ncbi:L-lactate dehydrogenase (quinone) large subunit LdhH [Desulfurispora thermophila]|uniref:L-lactate dehydrogenase (quinone) large subunit LdhH n=1 Tax=Desulfurispora thermophila TaxID=265470 RepID=UPI0003825B7B|nr:LUD domain-containing protein [Desulfurispora thermophila]
MVDYLKKDIATALGNPNLHTALGNFADDYVKSREKAYASRDFQALRQKVKAVKSSAAERMHELAKQFTARVEERGGKVYLARDAQAAVDYIIRLAKEKGVQTVVKSKSMASEEIHLNHHLQAQGIEAFETDLGEWIIQLCKQRPSHMVMPAIHMTRQQVAEVFSRATGQELPPDISRLVKVARENLRQKFLRADMGISGANIAIAETGTLVLLTNEGNARLVTTLPPIHVAVVGLEKLVASLQDALPIIEALPRSATGQQITSYVTMITGPVPAAGLDGTERPKEFHVVLLNNGRTGLRDDPEFKEALQCIRCASCLNVCPVYRLIGGHVFGDVYTGGIGTILTAFLGQNQEKAARLQTLCIQCGRCREFCPGLVDISGLLEKLRQRTQSQNKPGLAQRLVLEKVLGNRQLFHRLLRTAAAAQKPFVQGGMVRHLPLFLAGLTKEKSLPALAGRPLRERTKELARPQGKPRARVAFFAGCLTDFIYPQIGIATSRVLAALQMEMFFPLEQTCCGYPAGEAGFTDTFRRIARQNIAVFQQANADYIITPCPTCAAAWKKLYPQLLAEDADWATKANLLAQRVYDFSTFIMEQGGEALMRGCHPSGQTVTYHDSCHMKRTLGVFAAPRQLLNAAGYQLAEMRFSDVCCGFGGSYSLQYPELSAGMLQKKLQWIGESGAGIVATDCPGCTMQISGGLDRAGLPVKALHTAELLAKAIERS